MNRLFIKFEEYQSGSLSVASLESVALCEPVLMAMKKLPSFILKNARALSYEFETAIEKQFYKTERATPAHRENARQSATL